jgi:hypothetical protein
MFGNGSPTSGCPSANNSFARACGTNYSARACTNSCSSCSKFLFVKVALGGRTNVGNPRKVPWKFSVHIMTTRDGPATGVRFPKLKYHFSSPTQSNKSFIEFGGLLSSVPFVVVDITKNQRNN